MSCGDGRTAAVSGKDLEPLIEDVQFMLDTGESPAIAAARLGRTTANLGFILKRAGRLDLARPFRNDAKLERSRTGRGIGETP